VNESVSHFPARAAADASSGARETPKSSGATMNRARCRANFGDLRFPGKRDFIQATGTMNYERAGRASLRQRGCKPCRLHPRKKREHLPSAPAGLVAGQED